MTRKIRVLMVVEKLQGLGGAQKQALRLARALRGLDVSSTIVTGRWRYSEPRRTVVEEIPVTAVFTAFKMCHLKGLRKFGMYVYLVSLFLYLWRHRRRYDLIHVHSATVSAFTVALAGKWFNKPTVMKVMASGGWSDFARMQEGRELPGSAHMTSSFRHIRRVICLNPEAEAECRAQGFTDEQRVSIPNGFPVREVALRIEYAERDGVEVTFAGRLDAQKNPGMLLAAMAKVATSPGGEKVRARFLGDGVERGELQRRARELGVEDRITFHGRVTDVASYLLRSDIFVLPSLSEGLSNALLEAMAYGVPSVVTRIPGNTDLVRHRETGLLVEPGDTEAMARDILELAGDPALREKLGRAGRAFVEENFDIDRVAERYAELYRRLVGRNEAPPA
jgi:glycosyltransferase involved in cell wall biosynthesis